MSSHPNTRNPIARTLYLLYSHDMSSGVLHQNRQVSVEVSREWLPDLSHSSYSTVTADSSCNLSCILSIPALWAILKETILCSVCLCWLQGVRRLGAAAVDLCHVALGLVDAYWEYRLKPWDVAAGVLVSLARYCATFKPASYVNLKSDRCSSAISGRTIDETRLVHDQ